MKWAFENTWSLKHIKNYFENGKDECFPPKIFDWSMMFWLVKQSKSLNGQWLVNQLLILHPTPFLPSFLPSLIYGIPSFECKWPSRVANQLESIRRPPSAPFLTFLRPIVTLVDYDAGSSRSIIVFHLPIVTLTINFIWYQAQCNVRALGNPISGILPAV